jgi:hypothetical protein
MSVLGNNLLAQYYAQNQRRLPAGYEAVEYLESTGTQYIDTGYVMEDGKTMTFSGDVLWKSSAGNANFFFGYRSVNDAQYIGDMRAFFVYGGGTTGRLAIRYGKNLSNSTKTVSYNVPFNISFDGSNLSVDNEVFVTNTASSLAPSYKSMWLFNCNTTGYYSVDVFPFIGRMYSWIIKSNGVLVRSFVPCVRKSDNKSGLYDLCKSICPLTGTPFYINAGTGEFVTP